MSSLQNLAPGAVDRLGFDAETVRAANPRLIICAMSGYGSTGPYRDKKAYDLLIQCETGVGLGHRHARDASQGRHLGGGHRRRHVRLLAASWRRSTSASAPVRARALDVSLFDTLGEWMGYPIYLHRLRRRAAGAQWGQSCVDRALRPVHRAATACVNLAVQNEREWVKFCEVVLRRPDVATDPRFSSAGTRVEHRDELDAEIGEVFAGLTAAEVVARLDEAQIANARMNSVEEFIDHPQLAARDRWREIESPVGPLRALLPPVEMSGMDYAMGAIPALGAHTNTILCRAWLRRWRDREVREAGAI